MLVLSSISPLMRVEAPSKEAVGIFRSLEESEEHRNVKALFDREIPQRVKLEDHLGKNFIDLPFSFEEKQHLLQLPLSGLLHNQPLSTIDQLTLYYLYDAIIEPGITDSAVKPNVFLTDKRQLLQVGVAYPYDVMALVIPFNISQNDLIDWITHNWKNISSLNNKLPKNYATYISVNVGLGEEIKQLKEQGMSFTQISKELSEKYPSDERLCDANQIKLLYHRHIDFIKQSSESVEKLILIDRIINHPPVGVTD